MRGNGLSDRGMCSGAVKSHHHGHAEYGTDDDHGVAVLTVDDGLCPSQQQ